MTEIPFLYTELLFMLIWLICRVTVWLKLRRIEWKREAVLFLMYINLAVMIRFTFFPMQRLNGKVQPLLYDAASAFPFRVNLVPFVRLSDYKSRRDLLLNVIGNAALFIPSGIVLPTVYQKLASFRKTVGAAALISLCIEILQLPFSVRASDIDDLILNTVGAAVGYGILVLIRRLRRRKEQV